MTDIESRNYELKYPIQIGNETITIAPMPDRLKGKHLKKIAVLQEGQFTMGVITSIIAAVTGLSDFVIDEMDLEDIGELQDKIAVFFPELKTFTGLG